MTSLVARVASFGAAAALVACSTDHDSLAQRPDLPGPDGAIGDAFGSDSFPVTPRDTGSTADVRDPEPIGPWVLTLMNGVVDTGPVRFCLVPVVDGGEAPSDDPPVPAGGALPFGARTVLTTLGVDPATTEVHPYLVLDAVGPNAGWSCRQILANTGAPVAGSPDAAPEGSLLDAGSLDAAAPDGGALEAGAFDAGLSDAGLLDAGAPSAIALPVIPAGTLAEARSYLAVATGCSRNWALPNPAGDAGDGAPAGDGASTADGASPGDGGDARVDAGPDIAAVCGKGPGATTLGLSFVRLSRRVDFAKMGFQTVNASAATGPASLIVSQKVTETSVFFSDAIDFGQIAPRVQPSLVGRTDLGTPLGSAVLSVQPPLGLGTFPTFRNNLGAVLSTSRIDDVTLDGRNNFTFVFLGAQPGQYPPGAAAFTIRLVENAPNVGRD